jgi:hypothetical protein
MSFLFQINMSIMIYKSLSIFCLIFYLFVYSNLIDMIILSIWGPVDLQVKLFVCS